MRILVADDHDIIRLGLKQLLESRPGWEICAEAATGNEAVTLAIQFEPHVVVMDIGMPELNGLDATRKICCLAPNFLDSELSVFMQRLRAQAVAGEPGWA
jgi:DNA-binding NarL/FixJ family response regulator